MRNAIYTYLTLLSREVVIDQHAAVTSGIDTILERSKIEYKPELSYTKSPNLVDDDGEVEVPEELDVTLHEISILTPSMALERVEAIEDGYKELITHCEKVLATHVIQIDPDEKPQVSEAIIKACPLNKDGVVYNEDKINFTMFKQAVEGTYKSSLDAQIREAYEEANSGPYGLVEAEMYASLRISEQHWANFKKTLIKTYTDTSLMDPDKTGDEAKKSLVDNQTKMLQGWVDADKEKVQLQKSLESMKNDTSPDQDLIDKTQKRIDELDAKLAGFKDHPSVAISSVAHHRADSAEGILEKTRWTLLATVADSFNGMICCFIRKIIAKALDIPQLAKPNVSPQDLIHDLSISQYKTGSSDQEVIIKVRDIKEDIQKLKENVDGIIKDLKYVKVGLHYLMNGINIDLKSILGQILQLLEGPLNVVQNLIITTYTKLKAEATDPIFDWMKKMGEDPDTECLPFEQLGEVLAEALTSFDEKFRQAVLDLFKFTHLLDGMQEIHIAGISKKQGLRAVYQVIDKIVESLEGISKNLENFPVNSVEKMILELMKTNGWDYVYDAGQKKVVQMLSLNCEGGAR